MSFIALCVKAAVIMAVLLKMGWILRRWLAMVIATGLLIIVPLYFFLIQYFGIQQCLQAMDAELNAHLCTGGLGGVIISLILMEMMALSFIVGPIMGSRLHRRWSKGTP